ncbi:MAG: hypothetical protein ACPGWR_19685 [Ardenticatenaceae bacterium]
MFNLQHGIGVTGIDNHSFNNAQVGKFGGVYLIRADVVELEDVTGLTAPLVINMYPHVRDGSLEDLLKYIGSTARFVEPNSVGVAYIYILTELKLSIQGVQHELRQHLPSGLRITSVYGFQRVTTDDLLSTNWTLQFNRFAATYGTSYELLVTVGGE